MKFEWEEIFDNHNSSHFTCRAKVLNGWLVLHFGGYANRSTSSMVFLPDPEHKWEIER